MRVSCASSKFPQMHKQSQSNNNCTHRSRNADFRYISKDHWQREHIGFLNNCHVSFLSCERYIWLLQKTVRLCFRRANVIWLHLLGFAFICLSCSHFSIFAICSCGNLTAVRRSWLKKGCGTSRNTGSKNGQYASHVGRYVRSKSMLKQNCVIRTQMSFKRNHCMLMYWCGSMLQYALHR